MCIAANKDWFNFHITNVSYVQLAEYDAEYEGEYKKHHDVFWINNDQFHRKLSCVVQLTDPNEYEGGDLEMWSDGDFQTMPKQKGAAVLFPSFLLWPSYLGS